MPELHESSEKPLDRANAHVREAMAIACDYLKVASECQPPGQYAVAAQLISQLTVAAHTISRMQNGIGTDAIYVGTLPAD